MLSFRSTFVPLFLSKKYPFGDFTNLVKCVIIYTGEKERTRNTLKTLVYADVFVLFILPFKNCKAAFQNLKEINIDNNIDRYILLNCRKEHCI